jgi:hypothetical protein
LIIYGVKNNSDLGCTPFSKKPNLQVVEGKVHSFVQSPENCFVLNVVQGSENSSMVHQEFIPCIQQLKEENRLHLRYKKLISQKHKFDNILLECGELDEEEEVKLNVINEKISNTYSTFLGPGFPPMWFLLNADMSGKCICLYFFSLLYPICCRPWNRKRCLPCSFVDPKTIFKCHRRSISMLTVIFNDV